MFSLDTSTPLLTVTFVYPANVFIVAETGVPIAPTVQVDVSPGAKLYVPSVCCK